MARAKRIYILKQRFVFHSLRNFQKEIENMHVLRVSIELRNIRGNLGELAKKAVEILSCRLVFPAAHLSVLALRNFHSKLHVFHFLIKDRFPQMSATPERALQPER